MMHEEIGQIKGAERMNNTQACIGAENQGKNTVRAK